MEEKKKKGFWPKFSRRSKTAASDDVTEVEEVATQEAVLDAFLEAVQDGGIAESPAPKKKSFLPRLGWRLKSKKSKGSEPDSEESPAIEESTALEEPAMNPIVDEEPDDAPDEPDEDDSQEEAEPEVEAPAESEEEELETRVEPAIAMPETPGSISVYMQEVLDEVQKKGEEFRSNARKEAQQEAAQIIERARVEANSILDQARADVPDATTQQVEIILLEGRAKAAQIEADATKEAQRLQEETKDKLSGYVQEVMDQVNKMGENLRADALREAQIEAEQIIARAKQEAPGVAAHITQQATDAAAKQAEAIIQEGRSRAEAIEANAGLQVHQMLSDARDRVEGEVREDARSAYQWLLAILENFREQAQRVEDDWRGRSTEVREGVVRSRVEPENPNLLSPELVGAVAQEPVVEEPVAEPVEEPADVPSVEVNEPATVEPKAVDPLFSEPPSAEPEPESAPVDDGEPVAVLPDEDPAIPENLLLPVVRESEQKEQEPEAGGKSRAQRPRRGGDKKSNASAQPSVGLSPEALDAAKRTPYTGEVELVLAPPVSAATVARLYSDLTANPEIRILRTMGDWERGTTITLFLERPMPLVGMLSEIPEVTINAGDAEHLGLPTPGSQSTPGILISLSDPSVTAKE